MALTPSRIRAGACRALWDTGGSQVELGVTMEGSEFVIRKGAEIVEFEQWGIAAGDVIYNGEFVTAKLLIAEWDNTVLTKMLPGSTVGTGGSVIQWQFGSVAGVLASTIAKQLTLHPAKIASLVDESEDLVLYKAAPVWQDEPIRLGNRGPRVIPMLFVGLVVSGNNDGNHLGRWKKDAA